MKAYLAIAIAALSLMSTPLSAQSAPPAGCVTCQQLCVTCAQRLGRPSSQICRNSCVQWAKKQNVQQIYVRPAVNLCGTPSFSSARCI